MDVGLDVTAMISGSTGVARYARELWSRLAARPDVDVHPFAIGRPIVPLPPGVHHVRVPLRAVHGAWRHLSWPGARAVAGRPVDLVHAPDMVPPPGRTPAVVTIQDVLPLQLPEQYGPRYRRIALDQARAALRGAAVITSCEATADAIVDVLGLRREAITVALIGPREPEPSPAPPPVAGPYLLGVGSLTPRKGLHLLAEAVGRLPPDTPPLLLAGPDGWDAQAVHAHLATLDLGRRVQLLGAVSDRELDGLYQGALLLGHPSTAEGFGMPCLEAMRFGLPVVAADIPTVREICGGAAALVPPGDVDALAGAIAGLLADPAARARASAAGLERAKAFDWDVMADVIVARYRALLA